MSNIMINQNKDAILIDFDRVRKENVEIDNEEQTKDFASPEVAPEENKTYKSDIYSLGYIIHIILYGRPPIINNNLAIHENFKFKSCFEADPTKRPNINEMTNIFIIIFYFTKRLRKRHQACQTNPLNEQNEVKQKKKKKKKKKKKSFSTKEERLFQLE